MTTKVPVLTDKAPKPLPGIYSQAIIANGVVYCSGAVPMDATTGKLIDGDVKAHTVSVKTKPARGGYGLIGALNLAPVHQELDPCP